MSRRFRGLFVGVWILMLGIPALSYGHATLVRSEPGAAEVLSSPPAGVKVWFGKALEPLVSRVSVYDSDDRQVDKGDSRVSSKDSKMIEVGLAPLPPGTYRVEWVIAGRDGHRMKGDFTFTVKGAP